MKIVETIVWDDFFFQSPEVTHKLGCHPKFVTTGVSSCPHVFVYFESRKRELKIRLMNEGWCDERQKSDHTFLSPEKFLRLSPYTTRPHTSQNSHYSLSYFTFRERTINVYRHENISI
jgi:hypothetical protein